MKMQKSLWLEDTDLPAFPALEGDTHTDVLIVGGGLTGILCAWMLQRSGVETLLIEADRIMHGTSGHTTAKVTSQHGLIYSRLSREEGALYWRAQEEALERWRALGRSADCDFQDQPAYLYAAEDPFRLEEEMKAAEALNIPAVWEDRLPLPFPAAGAIRFDHQAQLHPVKAAAALVQGLNIREHTRAFAFDKGVVRTDHGVIRAEQVIMATHFPLINRHGSYFMKLYQDRSYVLGLRGAPETEGMYRSTDKDGLSLRSHGGVLLLGGGGHRTGKKSSGWELLEKAAERYYPQAQPVYRWAAQDCMTLDGMPYIGPYSRLTSRLWVATGFQKWGMTNAMAAAAILCDLVQGKRNDYAALFSPSRSMLHPQLAVNAAEAALHLLRPARPRCPHLGCALKWNPQEHSWDCPCHGSRFSGSGQLLNDPALRGLKRR